MLMWGRVALPMEPQELGEDGDGTLPIRQITNPIDTDLRLDLVRLRRCPSVQGEDRGADRRSGGICEEDRLHLTTEGDGADRSASAYVGG